MYLRILLLTQTLAGCVIPVAWVNPPLDASAAVAQRDGYGQPAVAGDFEVVALPLNAWQATADLPFDLGVGGRFHWARQDSQTFARPEARLTVPLTLWDDDLRLKVELSGGYTLDHATWDLDPLATVRLLWGVEGFVADETGGGCSGTNGFACIGGRFHGQFGGFVFAEGTYLQLGEEEVWLASAGLLLRAPAGFGAGVLVGLP